MLNEGVIISSVIYKVGMIFSLCLVEIVLFGVYVYFNLVIVNVCFEFVNLLVDNYIVSIFNILGVKEWFWCYYVDGGCMEKVDIFVLCKGIYFYSIVDSCGKIFVIKWLIVVCFQILVFLYIFVLF